ncbi:hypothetical protein ACQY0O_000602 [Thecaphora frezii]
MTYPFLSFSDLYEESRRSSLPPSPSSATSSLPSPVFLLPTNGATYRSNRHLQPTRTSTQSSIATTTSTSTSSSSSSRARKLARSLRNSLSLFRRDSDKAPVKSSWRTTESSPRSSMRHDALALDAPLSLQHGRSSNNTRDNLDKVTASLSDYQMLVLKTRNQEAAEEAQRQRDIQTYFTQAQGTELSLRRF